MLYVRDYDGDRLYEWDIPHYIQKDFQVYTGVINEIDYYGGTGRGPGSQTKFILDSGEKLHYRGILEDLNPNHQYKIEYLPNSEEIMVLVDLTTGEQWKHR